jgi:hypothetical protein
MDDPITTTEDVGSADLGGSQDMMQVHSPRWSMRVVSSVSHPKDGKHGMNLGSAERALDLYGGDGDDGSCDTGCDGVD